MFERDFQFWDVFSSNFYNITGIIIALVAILGCLIGLVFSIRGAIQEEDNIDRVGRIGFSMVAIVSAVMFSFFIGAIMENAQSSQVSDKAIEQIEDKYDFKVEQLTSMEINGQSESIPLTEIVEISGVIEIGRVEAADGNWFEPKFKFLLKEGEAIQLFPEYDPEASQLNPDTYLKK